MPLPVIRVASPCSESWDAMPGDERARHCQKCRTNVYNLSELSNAEVEALLRRSEGRLCARVFRRRDGTVLTRDCPVGLRRVRIQVAAAVGLATAMAMVALGPRASSKSRRESAWATLMTRVKLAESDLRRVAVIGPIIDWLDPEPTVGALEISTSRGAPPRPTPAPQTWEGGQ